MTVLTRRRLLKTAAIAGAGGIGLSAMGRFGGWAAAGPEPVVLQTAKIQAKLMDVGQTKDVLTYGDAGMPPVLRMRKGEPFAARLVNAIDDPTTIHWHGIRVPNKMDGVPFLVQPYVYTGDHFDYAFTPPDAGTFWYHPHCNTLTQMGHGLTGVIVVENPNDPKFDAEMVVNLRDWRLGDDGQFIEQFRPRDAAKTGTYGTVRTANWLDQPQYDAPAGGLVRLRVAITDVTRIYAFRVDGAEAAVIALDGNPVPQRFSPDALLLGPGQRMELAIRMPEGCREPAGREGHQAQNPGDAARDWKLPQARHSRCCTPGGQSSGGAGSRRCWAYFANAKRHGGKRSERWHLRFAWLQFLGDQQGAVARRYAGSNRAAGRTEARQELCHRHGKPDAAVASDASARHELQGAVVLDTPGSACHFRHLSHPAQREGSARLRRRQSRRLAAALPHHRAPEIGNDEL
jgi:hypothetical protein